MTVKEMREKMGLTKETLAARYSIPGEDIERWETGKENPPACYLEMLQNAIDHHIPRTKKEVMSLPLTVYELKYACDELIREGYGERSIFLSNDTEETGFHGMYYGLNLMEDSDTYVTLN